MMEIGYTMYTELLERAVKALRQGQKPELDKPLHHGAEIDLHVPALIPEDYLPDVHERLIMYKRISSAENKDELKELQVEMIDRFGLLPDAVKSLFTVTELKIKASKIGVKKVEYGSDGGRIIFIEQPDIDPMKIIQLIQAKPNTYKLDGNDKLRLIKPVKDLETRITELEKLFDHLAA